MPPLPPYRRVPVLYVEYLMVALSIVRQFDYGGVELVSSRMGAVQPSR